ncbi:DNA-directed RNA polymerase I subunit RPA2, putative [Plasmodium gallinaceum]|uniref:DNA-directed RNA polymerase subunit beta n=1 Tax=Plasmodium gallinaceum TaxID=5849 RepID=A0A1J1GVW0_PLAGA|nr:DNA-directed RNA polymerase I subunit RPA2, putative [Plasmodium gallinaceum]CRG96398.1 DNA-directed RNA polymerase I subunit RPA2, putative [Plasmodium gallinaceum]
MITNKHIIKREDEEKNIKRYSNNDILNNYNKNMEQNSLKNINLKITDEEIKLHLKIIESLYPNFKLQIGKLINGSYNIFTKFLVQSHLDDFNSFINVYIKNMPESIPAIEFSPQMNNYSVLNAYRNSSKYVKFYVSDIEIRNPLIKNEKGELRNDYPYLCKLSSRNYEGEIFIKINKQYNDEITSTVVSAGHIPIMVLSDLCNLSNLSKKELIKKGEDENLLGGFFIISGHLKVIRYVIYPKYNTLLLNEENKVHINCLLNDNTVFINFLTYSKYNFYSYGVKFQNSVITIPFHILIVLLSPIKKKNYIFNKIKIGIKNENAIKYIEQFINSIFIKNDINEKEIFEECNLSYLGRNSYFRRGIFRIYQVSHEKKGKYILKYCVLPHIQNNTEKFETLCLMFKKLVLSKFKLINCANKDSLEYHAVTTCSHLLANLLKDQIMTALSRFHYQYSRSFYKLLEKKYDIFKISVKQIYLRYKEMILNEIKEDHLNQIPLEDTSKDKNLNDQGDSNVLRYKNESKRKLRSIFIDEKEKLFTTVESYIEELFNDNTMFIEKVKAFSTISLAIIYFFKTGNISSDNLHYQQKSGWVISADEINNLRLLTNFRAIHRGCFFQDVKVLTPRKLLGESWGFICPVHTPDGSPCGLLNHLSQFCYIHNLASNESHKLNIKLYLKKIGINVNLDETSGIQVVFEDENIPIIVDSIPITYIGYKDFKRTVYKLKYAKNHNLYNLKSYFEINAYLNESSMMDCILINTFPGRIIRPLFNLKMKSIEFISPSYQPYVSIAINYEDIKKNNIARKLLKKREEIVNSKKKDEQKFTLKQQYLFHMNDKSVSSKIKNKLTNSSNYMLKKSNINKKVLKMLTENCYTKNTDSYISSSEYETSSNSCIDSEDNNISSTTYIDSDENINVDIYEQMPQKFEYMELKETSFLSFLASLTPFSDHNQSPRNIYQCQMLKQTMGIQSLNMLYTFTNKIYRMITPQLPLVVTRDYEFYGVDNYPSGTNAVVAILSYTGYDMEDALILNKGSVDRGIFQTHIYKTELIDLQKVAGSGDFVFGNNIKYTNSYKNNNNNYEHIGKMLNNDGLPSIQQKIKESSPLYSYINKKNELTTYESFKRHGEYYVDFVSLAKNNSNQIAIVKLRSTRKPQVGDKFASRHGQKGVVSMLFPHEDMPFSESGIVPDVIFNPHGIPSRMTIGMLIESICGKAASVYGKRIDATPFRKYTKQKSFNNQWIDNCGIKGYLQERNEKKNIFTEKEGYENIYTIQDNHKKEKKISFHTTSNENQNNSDNLNYQPNKKNKKNSAITYDDKIDYFAKLLLNRGYDYYGTELLYSGIYGVPLQAHIFIGVIYYQRLRHMAYDKAQVRRLGPVCNLTHQPLKGKRKHGGIRLGEMERDGIISHGCSFVINERFLMSSDGHECFVCPKCGLILSPILQFNVSGKIMKGRSIGGKNKMAVCKSCNVSCKIIYIPYVIRYLLNELICLNVTIRLNIKSVEDMFNLK